MNLGSKIGKPVWVDDATSSASRGLYSRVCVEVDLQKTLVSKFMLRRRIRKLEYECGMYDHTRETSPNQIRDDTGPPAARDGVQSDTNPKRQIGEEITGEFQEVNPEIVEQFGPWVLAKQNSRRHHPNQGVKLPYKGDKEKRQDGRSTNQINPVKLPTHTRFDTSLSDEDEDGMTGQIEEWNKEHNHWELPENPAKASGNQRRKERRPNVQVQVTVFRQQCANTE